MIPGTSTETVSIDKLLQVLSYIQELTLKLFVITTLVRRADTKYRAQLWQAEFEISNTNWSNTYIFWNLFSTERFINVINNLKFKQLCVKKVYKVFDASTIVCVHAILHIKFHFVLIVCSCVRQLILLLRSVLLYTAKIFKKLRWTGLSWFSVKNLMLTCTIFDNHNRFDAQSYFQCLTVFEDRAVLILLMYLSAVIFQK